LSHIRAIASAFSQTLALEKQRFINNCRTICVQQQVDRDTPRIIEYLKTDAGYREVEVSEEVAVYLRAFCTTTSRCAGSPTPESHGIPRARIALARLPAFSKHLVYSRLDEELELRLVEAETMGVGFEVPITPNAPRNSEELELELELQQQ